MSLSNEEKQRIFDEIAANDGGSLIPESVVRAAEPEDHPLHPEFDWNDAHAAHAHRIEQARKLIRGVRVSITIATKQITSVYYTRDPRAKPTEQGYRSYPQIRTERQLGIETVAAEFTRIEGMLIRARDMAESLGLSDEYDRAVLMLAVLHPVDEEAVA